MVYGLTCIGLRRIYIVVDEKSIIRLLHSNVWLGFNFVEFFVGVSDRYT